jgi:hypothetical protein
MEANVLIKMNIGEKYTIFYIDSMLAMTHKQEIVITRIDQNSRKYIYKVKGKRKEFYLNLRQRPAIFLGYNQPFSCDTDDAFNKGELGAFALTRIMRGNACYNFMGKADEIKIWIEENQLNPDFEKDRVLAIEGNEEIVVYPEFNSEHAVINRILREKEPRNENTI